MDFATYQAIPAVNWSALKHMDASPLAFCYRRANPAEDTTRLLLGRAVHTAVLEPDEFPLRYAVWDGARRAGKDWDEFKAANDGRDILKADEYRLCLDVRDAVRTHPIAGDWLDGCSEVVNTWTDADTGIACKCRIDHVCDGTLIDLKTTATIDARRFAATSARLLYHSQLAFYRRGFDTAPDVLIIAVEIDPPHDVAVFEPTQDALCAGDAQVSELLRRVAYYEERGTWPGRYESIQELPLPAWMADEADFEVGMTIGGVRL